MAKVKTKPTVQKATVPRNLPAQRSRKVENLLGEIPRSIEIWGIVVLVVVTLSLMLIATLFPHPAGNGESIMTFLISKYYL